MEDLRRLRGRRVSPAEVVTVVECRPLAGIWSYVAGRLDTYGPHIRQAEEAGGVLLVWDGLGWAGVRTVGGLGPAWGDPVGLYSARAEYTGRWWPPGTPLEWVLDEASGVAIHRPPPGRGPGRFPRTAGGCLGGR